MLSVEEKAKISNQVHFKLGKALKIYNLKKI